MAEQKKKQNPEAQRLHREEQARAARRRNRQFIGFALFILVVVGAVSIVLSGISLVRGMLDNTAEWDEYEQRFAPMVWFDFLPFESISTADENAIKQICLWGIYNATPAADIARDEGDQPLVPALEVEQYAVRLFGPDFRFSGHESFTNQEWDLSYFYNSETQVYTMPATGLEVRYLPTVVDVQRQSGGVRRVVIGYVSTHTSDNQVVQQPDYTRPVKYMDYMLRRDGNSYYLYAIQNNTTYVPSSPVQSQSVPSMAGASSASDYLPPPSTLTPAASSSAGEAPPPASSRSDSAGGSGSPVENNSSEDQEDQ